jgi:hypothetical protein
LVRACWLAAANAMWPKVRGIDRTGSKKQKGIEEAADPRNPRATAEHHHPLASKYVLVIEFHTAFASFFF